MQVSDCLVNICIATSSASPALGTFPSRGRHIASLFARKLQPLARVDDIGGFDAVGPGDLPPPPAAAQLVPGDLPQGIPRLDSVLRV